GEHYGLDILRVREIRAWQAPRALPNLPAFISGVMDFRGGVVPVIDLRKRFNLETAGIDRETVIIVVNVQHAGQELEMGMVVDRVADVVDVKPDEVRPPPALGAQLDTRFMSGMISLADRMVVLVDVDRMLDPDSFAQVLSVAGDENQSGGADDGAL
ncbi:MAG: chemotaxis protein CheW, partial [Gammaproteobacteria bacterium]